MKDKQFVVQEHETADGVHWDLMLEQDEVLTTFRLEEPPEQVLVHPLSLIHISEPTRPY